MGTSLITSLKLNTFRDVKRGPDDKPLLIADGKLIRIADLDAPVEAGAAYVVGVNQKTFETVCRYLRPDILHFYQMRVSDIAPLTALRGLRRLAIRWNTKLADISPLRRLLRLEVLVLEDTPKVLDLSPIAACAELSAVEYSGGIWSKNTAASLTPLADLPVLEELVLTNLKVQADGLKPIAKCRRLRTLNVSNQFPTEDYALLSVALPQVECDMLAPHVRLSQAIDGKDVMVVGSRKPLLSSKDDATRIEKYERAFEALREGFAARLIGSELER